MLEAIDQIKKDFVGLDANELRSSKSFDKAWRDVFWQVGPILWPEIDLDSEFPEDPEFYARPLLFLETHDRAMYVQPITSRSPTWLTSSWIGEAVFRIGVREVSPTLNSLCPVQQVF